MQNKLILRGALPGWMRSSVLLSVVSSIYLPIYLLHTADSRSKHTSEGLASEGPLLDNNRRIYWCNKYFGPFHDLQEVNICNQLTFLIMATCLMRLKYSCHRSTNFCFLQCLCRISRKTYKFWSLQEHSVVIRNLRG